MSTSEEKKEGMRQLEEYFNRMRAHAERDDFKDLAVEAMHLLANSVATHSLGLDKEAQRANARLAGWYLEETICRILGLDYKEAG